MNNYQISFQHIDQQGELLPDTYMIPGDPSIKLSLDTAQSIITRLDGWGYQVANIVLHGSNGIRDSHTRRMYLDIGLIQHSTSIYTVWKYTFNPTNHSSQKTSVLPTGQGFITPNMALNYIRRDSYLRETVILSSDVQMEICKGSDIIHRVTPASLFGLNLEI